MADMHTPLISDFRNILDADGNLVALVSDRAGIRARDAIITAVNERADLLARASQDAETIKALEQQIATKDAALLKWAEYDQLLRSLPGEGPLYGGQMADVDAAYDACRDATEVALAGSAS